MRVITRQKKKKENSFKTKPYLNAQKMRLQFKLKYFNVCYFILFLVIIIVRNNLTKAVSSAVEHLPYKQRATGSSPVPPILTYNKGPIV